MSKMIDKMFDIMGVFGFFLAAGTAWFSELIHNFDISMKFATLIGGLILLFMSILHKHIQIKNEKSKQALEELRQKQDEVLEDIDEKIVNNDSESNRKES